MRTLLRHLFSQAKTKGCQSRVDIGVKYADKQQRMFDDEKMKAGQCVIGLQVQFSVSVISQDWCSQSETRGQGFKRKCRQGTKLDSFPFFIFYFFSFWNIKIKKLEIRIFYFYFIFLNDLIILAAFWQVGYVLSKLNSLLQVAKLLWKKALSWWSHVE